MASLLKILLIHRFFQTFCLEKPITWFLHKSNVGRKWVKDLVWLGWISKMVTKPRWLKYLKYCCAGVSLLWIFLRVINYWLGSVNDFWFCGILTDRLVSKIFWRHWLYECSRSFAWFLQKLQWFNKNTQFSIYPIWNIYSTMAY